MILKYINKNFFLLVLAALLVSNVQAQTPEGVLVDKIIAKVDNYIILKSELERAYLDYLSRGQVSGSDAKCQILESLVINKLLVAKAEIDSIIVSDIEVEGNLDNRVQYILGQVGGTEEALEEYYGKSLENIKDELRTDIKEQLTAQRMQGSITESITVTPSEVKKFYNRIPQDSLPFYSTEVTLGQIVKIPSLSKTEKDKVNKQLNEIRQKILTGETTFGEMAKKYSEDPGSAARGGEYSWITRGQFAPEYEAVCFKMKVNEISKPIQTDFGLHIVQLLERRGNEYRSRHILISPQFVESDFETAENFLDSVANKIKTDSISFEKTANELSDDKKTASSGGFFLDQNEVPRISVDQLEPTVFFTIDTMKIGSISEPLRFRMEDGKEAVRILYYKAKIPPHQANLKQDYQKIYAATLNRKKSDKLNRWFKEAKGDVFIEVDDEFNTCLLLE